MQQDQIHIREGQPADIPAVMGLIHELAHYERAAHEVINTPEQLLEDGFGKQPLYGFYVAEFQEIIAGMALFYYRYSTWKGKVLYLEDLYVKPEFRQQKIGTLLLKALAQRAGQEKCQRMSWQVLNWNEPAINFYKKLGAHLDDEWINVFIEAKDYDLI
ncbi:MAG: GNAT family N-acetyltransferase [Microscillaceae bacterium]|nr:GNAT family N-acetyltransferase [Microscillaceae bacterium]